MNGYPLIVPKPQFFDQNGDPLAGGTLESYLDGGVTPEPLYSDGDATISAGTTFTLNSRGEPDTPLFAKHGTAYTFVLKDALGATIYTVPGYMLTQALTKGIIGALLYPLTEAEDVANVTPTDYSYQPLDPRRYGLAESSTAAQNATALANSLLVAAVDGGIVQMPEGAFDFNSKLTIPTAVQLRGATMGFGSNISTVLRFTGSGIAIQVDGSYSRLADFMLKNGGTGTVGVYVTSTQFTMDRVTIMPDVSTGFSVAGYQSKTNGLVFTHLLKRCYIYGNAIGVDFSWGNNFVIDQCFIESNGTNVRVGWTGAVTNFVICNGSVIEHFGDGRAAESLTSIGVDLIDVTGFAIRDSYFETDGSGGVGAAGQLGINLRTVKGGAIAGNYFYGGGQATTIINAQATALDVTIGGNAFISVAGYGITEAVGSRIEVGNNSAPSPTTGVINRTGAPVPVGLTVVNGTGGATYSTTWQRLGKRVFFSVKIAVTGTATTASTAGTSYFPFLSAMPTPLDIDVCFAVSDDGTNNYGTGLVATNGRVYAPTWAAVNKGIVVSGSYRCA